jgi:transcriptional regulator with GAF, ATPase, and Fis domain
MSVDHTRRARGATVVSYSKTRIAVTSGPNAGLKLDFAASSVRVGTAPDNDIVLTDDSVSRHHCEFASTEEGLRLRDMQSTNGIVANGLRVYEATLTGPSTVALGDTTLTITPLPDVVSREQVGDDRFGDVLGGSPRMRELFADLERIAPTDLALLVEGETGTGKDLVAESVHRASPRAEQPFVVFDCGAVSPTLAESELFGHERGAFTGAVNARPGVFEQAHGGTVFLDELGELPKDLQPKLLRVLEKHEVRRVGGTKTIPIDVRLIAATNRNLMAEVERGNFRQDLYFRVAAAHVIVPALRDRMEDLPILTQFFLSRERPPRTLEDIPPAVWEMFRVHRWPGNVRELRNAVQRLLVTPERAIRSSLGPPGSAQPPSVPAPSSEDSNEPIAPLRLARREANDNFEKDYLEAILKRTQGNVTRAAAIAEVSRQVMTKLIRKHGLREARS